MQWDRSGQPITMLDWVLKVGDPAYREVALTEADNVKIHTCWHGVTGGFDVEQRPFIFETAVYDHGTLIRKRRYASEHEALCGHVEECASVRAEP